MDNNKYKFEAVEWKGETLTKPIGDEVIDIGRIMEKNGYSYEKNKLRIDTMLNIMMSKDVDFDNLSVGFEKYGEDDLLLVLECDSNTLKVMLAK